MSYISDVANCGWESLKPFSSICTKSTLHANPGYGVAPRENISQRSTPYAHTSDCVEKFISRRLSIAIARQGRGSYAKKYIYCICKLL